MGKSSTGYQPIEQNTPETNDEGEEYPQLRIQQPQVCYLYLRRIIIFCDHPCEIRNLANGVFLALMNGRLPLASLIKQPYPLLSD